MEDVYGNIANFFDVSQEITLNTVSKNIMNKFNVKKENYEKNAQIIHDFYIRNSIRNFYNDFVIGDDLSIEDYIDIIINRQILSKHQYIRCYMVYYPEIYLYEYPEFFMKKMIKYNSNRFSENEKNTLNNFIRENKDKKNRRYVYDFLNHDFIRVSDLIYVGW